MRIREKTAVQRQTPAGRIAFHKVDYIEQKDQGKDRRQAEIKAVKIDLEAKPLESNLESVENFSFMGFLNNISFSIDPERNLPVEIRGEIPPVGKVTIS